MRTPLFTDGRYEFLPNLYSNMKPLSYDAKLGITCVVLFALLCGLGIFILEVILPSMLKQTAKEHCVPVNVLIDGIKRQGFDCTTLLVKNKS